MPHRTGDLPAQSSVMNGALRNRLIVDVNDQFEVVLAHDTISMRDHVAKIPCRSNMK